ncbi:hypothetical protein N2152v2_005066 [Parachlorella kessleri]
MSGDTRIKQVWMPTLGVWAAVKTSQDASGSAQASQRASSDLQEGRVRRKRKHDARQEGSTPPHAPAQLTPGSRQEQPEQQQHHHHGQEQEQRNEEEQPHHHDHKQQGYTGFQLQEQPSDGEPSEDEVVEVEPPPHCSICLLDVVHLEEKAVLLPCMHAYHHDCISQWLDRKRLCPLCKARVTAVLHDIQSSGDYREREIPPSPPPPPPPPPGLPSFAPLLRDLGAFAGGDRGSAAAHFGLSASLRDSLAEVLYGARTASAAAGGGAPAAAVEFQGGDELGAWGEQRRQRGGSDARRAGGRAARLGSSLDRQRQRQQQQQQQQPEPRPYFWRVHQHMQASGLGGRPGAFESTEEGGWLGVAASSGEGGMMAWRRRVYEQGLYADPPLVEDRSRISVGSGSSRERRLSEWLDRELRVLLRTDDVTIIKGFVLGLVALSGLDNSTPSTSPPSSSQMRGSLQYQLSQQQQKQQQRSPSSGLGAPVAVGRVGAGASRADPVAALLPFLHEHAAHFWHELRCFATSPFTLQTYDRIVHYSSNPPSSLQTAQRLAPSLREVQQAQQVQQALGPQSGASGGSSASGWVPGAWAQQAGQRGRTTLPSLASPPAVRRTRWDRGGAGTALAPGTGGPPAVVPPAQHTQGSLQPARPAVVAGGADAVREQAQHAEQTQQQAGVAQPAWSQRLIHPPEILFQAPRSLRQLSSGLEKPPGSLHHPGSRQGSRPAGSKDHSRDSRRCRRSTSPSRGRSRSYARSRDSPASGSRSRSSSRGHSRGRRRRGSSSSPGWRRRHRKRDRGGWQSNSAAVDRSSGDRAESMQQLRHDRGLGGSPQGSPSLFDDGLRGRRRRHRPAEDVWMPGQELGPLQLSTLGGCHAHSPVGVRSPDRRKDGEDAGVEQWAEDGGRWEMWGEVAEAVALQQ